mmetsp:Transcript_38065/g.60203  ORF Transcript_38065/g.60203 Transcript_38065/m.60203 type:complete len:216 (+) Transcript_38065:1451-2098(+)
MVLFKQIEDMVSILGRRCKVEENKQKQKQNQKQKQKRNSFKVVKEKEFLLIKKQSILSLGLTFFLSFFFLFSFSPLPLFLFFFLFLFLSPPFLFILLLSILSSPLLRRIEDLISPSCIVFMHLFRHLSTVSDIIITRPSLRILLAVEVIFNCFHVHLSPQSFHSIFLSSQKSEFGAGDWVQEGFHHRPKHSEHRWGVEEIASMEAFWVVSLHVVG